MLYIQYFTRNVYDVPHYFHGCLCFCYESWKGLWIMDDFGNAYKVNHLSENCATYFAGEDA